VILVALAVALASTPAAGDAAPAPVPSAQLLREAENAYAELRRSGELTNRDAAADELIGRLETARIEPRTVPRR
jgi:hypothetical protein